VADGVVGAEYMRASARRADYSKRCVASDELAGSETNLDLAGRIAVLPVRTD
jgi:hypothetical protein